MEKKPYFCIICGREFEPKQPNAKYCSAGCRKAGQRMRRRAWEARTGYKEAKREKQRELRQKIKAEAEAEQDHDRKLRSAIRSQRHENRIANASPGGSALMQMAQAEMTSETYWLAYQQYDRAFASHHGKVSHTTVCGISVTERNFAKLVCQQIRKGARIVEQVHHIRISRQDIQKQPK